MERDRKSVEAACKRLNCALSGITRSYSVVYIVVRSLRRRVEEYVPQSELEIA